MDTHRHDLPCCLQSAAAAERDRLQTLHRRELDRLLEEKAQLQEQLHQARSKAQEGTGATGDAESTEEEEELARRARAAMQQSRLQGAHRYGAGLAEGHFSTEQGLAWDCLVAPHTEVKRCWLVAEEPLEGGGGQSADERRF